MIERSKKNKSIKLNSIVYGLKVLVGILSPMITFPYVCRVLSVDNIGSVSFSASIISYFALLSALGISSYAVRNGVKYKDDQEKFNDYASQIFTINICSTVISYLLYVIILVQSDKWQQYLPIMLIISVTIPMTTIGMEWIFTIYEDYVYITVRSLIVQAAAMLFLFIMVKNDTDIIWYAVYTVLVNVGSNVFNFINVRKYCKIKLRISKDLRQHLKPILILFASAVACQIYLNSDITMLGYMASDREVGLYSAGVKIYNLAKTLLGVFITVSIPRLAYYAGMDKLNYEQLLRKLVNTLILFLIPATAGMVLISKEIVIVISGMEFLSAGNTLKLLVLAMPVSVMGSCLSSACLLPYKKDNQILYATLVGAVLNVILNVFFIPKWGENGAALTTLIAEIIVFCIHLYNVRKILSLTGWLKNFIQCIIAIIPMIIICLFVTRTIDNQYLSVIIAVLAGAVSYFIVLMLEKNELIFNYMEELFSRIRRRN